jgi:hypothetical protein
MIDGATPEERKAKPFRPRHERFPVARGAEYLLFGHIVGGQLSGIRDRAIRRPLNTGAPRLEARAGSTNAKRASPFRDCRRTGSTSHVRTRTTDSTLAACCRRCAAGREGHAGLVWRYRQYVRHDQLLPAEEEARAARSER